MNIVMLQINKKKKKGIYIAYEIHLHLELTFQVLISQGAIENKIHVFSQNQKKMYLLMSFPHIIYNNYFHHFMICKKH